jgi:hypothetical protein
MLSPCRSAPIGLALGLPKVRSPICWRMAGARGRDRRSGMIGAEMANLFLRDCGARIGFHGI